MLKRRWTTSAHPLNWFGISCIWAACYNFCFLKWSSLSRRLTLMRLFISCSFGTPRSTVWKSKWQGIEKAPVAKLPFNLLLKFRQLRRRLALEHLLHVGGHSFVDALTPLSRRLILGPFAIDKRSKLSQACQPKTLIGTLKDKNHLSMTSWSTRIELAIFKMRRMSYMSTQVQRSRG